MFVLCVCVIRILIATRIGRALVVNFILDSSESFERSRHGRFLRGGLADYSFIRHGVGGFQRGAGLYRCTDGPVVDHFQFCGTNVLSRRRSAADAVWRELIRGITP